MRPLTLAFASCQHYEQGYYTAYEHMVREQLDAVAFLGDYIYESGPNHANPRAARERRAVDARRTIGPGTRSTRRDAGTPGDARRGVRGC